MSTLDVLESILKAKIRSSWPYTLVVAMICLAALWVGVELRKLSPATK